MRWWFPDQTPAGLSFSFVFPPGRSTPRTALTRIRTTKIHQFWREGPRQTCFDFRTGRERKRSEEEGGTCKDAMLPEEVVGLRAMIRSREQVWCFRVAAQEEPGMDARRRAALDYMHKAGLVHSVPSSGCTRCPSFPLCRSEESFEVGRSLWWRLPVQLCFGPLIASSKVREPLHGNPGSIPIRSRAELKTGFHTGKCSVV